jgi:hypothetical protein
MVREERWRWRGWLALARVVCIPRERSGFARASALAVRKRQRAIYSSAAATLVAGGNAAGRKVVDSIQPRLTLSKLSRMRDAFKS